MHRLINYKNILVTGFGFLCLPRFGYEQRKRGHHRCVALLYRILLFSFFLKRKTFVVLCAFVSLWATSLAQRQDISLNNNWTTSINNKDWKTINVPHNWDDYYGYRRLLHGNLHGVALYKRNISIKQSKSGKRFFLFFEGAGSYATVFLNNKKVGEHNGGRTTFTIDITNELRTDGSNNQLLVSASHPANIQDLPWVCGGCSDERGFSEGSQPMGIFRPVHLIVTNDVRIEPFGVHAWADINDAGTTLNIEATVKNYAAVSKQLTLEHILIDAAGKEISRATAPLQITNRETAEKKSAIPNLQSKITPWSIEKPYLYKIITLVKENNIIVDKLETDFGFRTIKWNNPSHQFTLNGKPVFINGIAEYEHLLGQSHAFSNEQIEARVKWVQSAGFNAFRDGHQPHNLLYGKLFNQKGILWWTQLSAHVWYDTKEFRNNFKQLLKEWVIERRNDPSVILWGLQNESKLPKDFAAECTALIRSLDPTASTQRLVTTCNGGEGTDWDVPQNWTGTYGGNPATYGEDLKKQILVGEYGAWRTIELHTEGGFDQNGAYSEDRMTLLLEQKIRLAEKVKDSVAGHFMWLLTSHDNPGRVQGGEGLRELDRIGPVNYKGLLTPWEEPTDAFYMYRSNYADKQKEPMVYIVSHTWPNRWMTPGIKNGIIVYSNCDEVELFNDMDGASLGKQKRMGIGTHFQWDSVNIRYNVLYSVGYVNGKAVAKDTVVLLHLPQAPHFNKLYTSASDILKGQPGYSYIYLTNCGGPEYDDEYKRHWSADIANSALYKSSSWSNDFPGVPSFFASQRRTFSPIKNTRDWKLFQDFRYGKNKLQYEYQLHEDGEYLVELYFIEPWLGIGGGMNAEGMRLFDVAINGKTVLKDVDIWKEAGSNNVLKKMVKIKTSNRKIVISFPNSSSGEALIAAIAIGHTKNYDHIKKLIKPGKLDMGYEYHSWMDIGGRQYDDENILFNSLPPNLYGADYISFKNKTVSPVINWEAITDSYLFVACVKGREKPSLISGFENTGTEIVTDENGGTIYTVYRKLFSKGSNFQLKLPADCIIAMQPAGNMPPAYDLKPITQYKTSQVKLSEGAIKDSANGRYCAVVKTNNPVTIDYPVQTGVGDRYSVTVKYFYGGEQAVHGKWQLVDAGGNRMQEEPVTFSFTKPGKWNQFTINTSSQINAGNYTVRLVVENGEGLALSGIDVQ